MKKIAFTLSLVFLLNSAFSQQWVPVSINTAPPNFDMLDISVVSENVVWVVADSIHQNSFTGPNNIPMVLRTVDGGNNWDVFRVEEAIGRFVWSIQGFDENTAIFTTNQFLASDTRPIFKTTDGGQSWMQITPPAASGGLLIHFFDAMNGVVNNRQGTSTTTDGGNTWTQVTSPAAPVFAANEFNILNYTCNFSAQAGDRVWIGTSKGRIYRTLDRGYNWTMKQVGTANDCIMSIAFTDTLHGVASSIGTYSPSTGLLNYYFESKLFYTSDGGDTWTPVADVPIGRVTTLEAVPGAPGHFFGGSFIEQFSGNASTSISLNSNYLAPDAWESTSADSFRLQGAEFLSPTLGYAIGWSARASEEVIINGNTFANNYILKWTGNVVPAQDLKDPVQEVRVFPNPVSDWLTIQLPDPASAAFVRLSDWSGKVIFEDEMAEPRLLMKSLPAGAYWLQVQSGENVTLHKVIRQ
ncbi:MAG: T9SS type A sorting domain-containing protein [Saprospiraceae bacterium]|nr:T9SS type A sorting domain-containing protein [Saprospiraceae bacterium]